MVAEDEDRSLVDRESFEGPVEGRRVNDVRSVVGCRFGVGLEPAYDVGCGDLADARSLSQGHPAGVDDDPAEPGVEPLDIAQPADRPPSGEQCLLRRVLRVGRSTKDCQRGPIHVTNPIAYECLECGSIAALRCPDEIARHSPSSLIRRLA